jgi:uncharacterized membrane protein YeiB
MNDRIDPIDILRGFSVLGILTNKKIYTGSNGNAKARGYHG